MIFFSLSQLKNALSLLNKAQMVLFPRGCGLVLLRFVSVAVGISLNIRGYSSCRVCSFRRKLSMSLSVSLSIVSMSKVKFFLSLFDSWTIISYLRRARTRTSKFFFHTSDLLPSRFPFTFFLALSRKSIMWSKKERFSCSSSFSRYFSGWWNLSITACSHALVSVSFAAFSYSLITVCFRLSIVFLA